MSTTSTYDIRDGHGEYAEFFVNEREPVPRSDGLMRYTATWVCYSSFGVFGHHWYDMGEPFAVFVQGVSDDYLLSKIARKVTSAKKTIEGVKRAVLNARRECRVTSDIARDALDSIACISDDAPDEAVPHLLWESVEISRCDIDWCDLETQVWETQALMFVKKLWPLFVKAVDPAKTKQDLIDAITQPH